MLNGTFLSSHMLGCQYGRGSIGSAGSGPRREEVAEPRCRSFMVDGRTPPPLLKSSSPPFLLLQLPHPCSLEK